MKRKILEERLNLLESQKVIGRKAAEAVRIAMNVLHSEGAVIDEERAVSFFTHLAMAVQRLEEERKEEIRLDPAIYQEIQEQESFGLAKKLLEKLSEKTGLVFPECEKEFLLVHLCTLLEL